MKDFEPLSIIGRGAFGEVRICKFKETGEIVAMKKMKKSEIKALSVEQLKQNVAAEQDRLLKLKFAHAITPIENPMRIRQSRRLIAQLMTELNAR